MYDIELHIKAKDWLYVLLIGILFGSILAAMGYWLSGAAWMQGALFGTITGFTITLFSLVFVTFMNQRILPNVDRRYWLPLAVFFSFLSGFLGALISIETAWRYGIEMLTLFHRHEVEIATSIGVLTYIVGTLLYRFVRMRNEKEEVNRHYTESRLRSLETQLNPHFLFNALNSLAELVHRDSNRAEEAILKLSAFLRNTMSEKALIPMAEEIANVKSYVELENIRFSDRIRLDVEGPLPPWQLPKFSIQLLAENAIKHGRMGQTGVLTIRIRFEPSQYRTVVSNDGTPMPEARPGIGLSNLDERLRLLCGGRLEIAKSAPPTFHLYIGACHEDPDRR
jgi:sensor histidine kinase YesM